MYLLLAPFITIITAEFSPLVFKPQIIAMEPGPIFPDYPKNFPGCFFIAGFPLFYSSASASSSVISRLW